MQRNERPHFIRTVASMKQREKLLNQKSKMLILILKRITYSKLRLYIMTMKKSGDERYLILDKAIKRVSRNNQISVLIAWKKLVTEARIKRKDQLLLKLAINIGNKYKKWRLAQTFRLIEKYGRKKILLLNSTLQNAKKKIIQLLFNRIYRKNKEETFKKLKANSFLVLSQKSKKLVLSNLLINLFKRREYFAWSRCISVMNAEHNDIQHQLGQLNKQNETIKKQLVKNNQYIQQLQSRLEYMITDNVNPKSSNQRQSSLQNSRRFRGGSFKRNSSQDFSQKRSQAGNENGNNTSILSWLNGSFASLRSGKSSMSKIGDCYCKYREKYNQYRAESCSLKNQLDIIKSELQVTKDLNEHLQEEISNLCINSPVSIETEMMRKQLKELKKQKESLKEKLINNQKYIANLKFQFKMKIQNLYRNLKKNN